MKVSDMMKRDAKSCSKSTNLARVAEQLWTSGCGALPVVDGGSKVVGIITDRDICVALGTRNLRPCDLTAEQVMSKDVATCHTDDDIHKALQTMKARKVRRVPIVNDNGKLEGMLSLSDLILCARHDDGSNPCLSYEDVVNTLKAIYWHHCVDLAPPTLASVR